MAENGWTPAPLDTSGIELDAGLLALVEELAENAHARWARRRFAEGWRPGAERSDTALTHPLLVPYPELPEPEKEYDRELAVETLKLVLRLGYRIVPPA
ncbi:RyR domain-containing protein [Streptomyces sp. NPDC007095]|jgi:hypothetical protein|uniref:RyR domain-containing protein n=1 Tax=Streptomyces sp. NPDC007095 TaxID=3154482 RepID=UPI000C70BD26